VIEIRDKPDMPLRHGGKALETKLDYLRLVNDTIPTMAWSVRPDGALDFVNQRWTEYTGLSVEDALANSNGTVHPDDLPDVTQKWLAVMAAGGEYEGEMRLRGADGAYRWFLVRTVPLRDEQGSIVKWYGTSTDVDDRKHAENALRDSGIQLHALARRLVDLQESAHKELARELHDRMGPPLTSLSINLKLIEDALPSAQQQALAGTLVDARQQIHEASMAMRDVIGELRPQELDDHGLQPALDRYARQFSQRAGIAVSVRTAAPYERVSADVEIVLFRIAQEALNNVAKHARAKHVTITLERQGSDCVMAVLDDGIGIARSRESTDPSRTALGLVTMRERAQTVGGVLTVEAGARRGTQLTVRVPHRYFR
jgi:two-component system sensor histidine kinase UhpB